MLKNQILEIHIAKVDSCILQILFRDTPLRNAVRKKWDYMGKIAKWRTTPQLGKPLSSKKKS